MKVKPFLGPFSDSSLPAIYEGKAYELTQLTNPFYHQIKYEGGHTEWVKKDNTQQLYAEVEENCPKCNGFGFVYVDVEDEECGTVQGKKWCGECNTQGTIKKQYLVSYSPKDYPLPDEVEGDVVKIYGHSGEVPKYFKIKKDMKKLSESDVKKIFGESVETKLPEKKTIVQNPMDYAKNAAAKESTYLPKEMRQAGYDIVDGELKQPDKDIVRIGNDNICPITKQKCDDETCTPGAECNISGDQLISDCGPEVMPERQPVSFTPEQRERVVELLAEYNCRAHAPNFIKERMPHAWQEYIRHAEEWLNNQNI